MRCPNCDSAAAHPDQSFCADCGTPFEPGGGTGPAGLRPRVPRRGLTAVVAAVGAVVLGAGAAFGVGALTGKFDQAEDPSPAGGGFAQSGESPSAELTVNNPPDLAEPEFWFADGYRESWSVSAPSDDDYRGVAVGEDAIVTVELVGLDIKRGWDRADGSQLWSSQESTGGIVGCQYGGISGQILCVTGADSARYFFVDPVTGANASPTQEGQSRGVPSEAPSDGWGCSPYPAATGILWACAIAEFYDMPIEGYAAVWTDPQGQTLWQSEQVPRKELEGTDYVPDYTPPVVDEHDGLVGFASYWTSRAMLLEVATGQDLLSGANCQQVQIFDDGQVWCYNPDVKGTLTGAQCDALNVETADVALADGSSVTIHSASHRLVDFFDGYHPRDAVYLPTCEGTFTALDPGSGEDLYSVTDRPILELGIPVWGLYGGGDLVGFADQSGALTMVEVASGQTALVRAATGAVGIALGLGNTVVPTFLDQATFAMATHDYAAAQATLEVFDARTGDVVLRRQAALEEGELYTVPTARWQWHSASRGGEPYVLEDNGQTLTLWEKDLGAAPVKVEPVSLPSGLPKCPDGQDPLIWAQFGDDYVIVCGSADATAFSVAAKEGGAELTAVQLTFSDGGCAVKFNNEKEIYLSLGGAYVTKTDGTVTAASDSWSWRAGQVKFATPPPADWLTCPAGSWPIALSTYGDGHVLVCGTALDQATLLKWNDAELGEGESGDVAAEAGGWCATANQIKACSFAAPALVSYTAQGGAE
ncbi:MAG: hypothetical protein LBU05_03725, partial [Bifidobacteriaceae bacterium]|nr:hypothetical protein [Bifidobacteriaceae bacterium]